MRDDLTASEKRLIAALDRLDHFIDRAALMRGAVVAAEPVADDPAGIEHSLHAARTENQRLSNELMLAHERQQAQLAASQAELAAAHDRLLAAGQEAARLASEREAAERERKIAGVEFEGVMCSATAEDQAGLAAVLVAIQMQGAAFQPTVFHFENGSRLVIHPGNWQALAATWLPFRQSFFLVDEEA